MERTLVIVFLKIPLAELDGTTVRLTGKATPEPLRYLDCDAFTDSQILLHVIEIIPRVHSEELSLRRDIIPLDRPAAA